MAGAFVAVADDASAVHWNPAGLPVGRLVGLTIGWDGFQFRNPDLPPTPGAERETGGLISLGTWPLGVSYGRFQSATLVSDVDGTLTAQGLRTHQFGVTLVQSIGDYIVVGSTLKYIRGTATSEPVAAGSSGAALGDVLNLDADSQGAFDLDLGVLADLGTFRAGFTLKNVLEPSFAKPAGTAIHLPRRARLGLAWLPTDGLTLAIDVDLDTADPSVGLREMVALGGETRLGSRVLLRGGVRWLRDSGTRPIGAFGGSLQLHQRLWLDGQVAYGRADEDRGFGIAIRAGY